VSSIIANVLSILADINVDRLPKPSVVKLTAVEANALSKTQVAKKLLSSENLTLQFDGTSK
jgi:hypothetical protein